jgi:chemotaxis protein histidine kinase CheA
MDRKKRLDKLHLQITELKEKFRELGIRLVEEGESLKKPDFPPEHLSEQDVANQLDVFRLLSQKYEKGADDLSTPKIIEGINEGINAYVEIEKIWHSLADHLVYLSMLGEQNRRAQAIIKRCKEIEISLTGKESLAELANFKDKLTHYEAILSGDPEDTETAKLRNQLAMEVHPLNALLRLTEEQLDHEEAAGLFQTSAGEFGILLTVAAARKGLLFRQEETVKMEQPVTETELSAAAKEEEEVGEEEATAEVEQEVEEEEEKAASAVAEKAATAEVEEVAAIAAEEAAGTEAAQEAEEAPAEAEEAPAATSAPAAAELSAQIIDLIKEGKLVPAYWLSCYSEQQYGDAPFPSWLLQAAELAEVIEGDGGPAGTWLSYIYSNYDFGPLLEVEPAEERKKSLALLMYASLLKPALVAPGSGAPQLIRQLNDLPLGLGGFSEISASLTAQHDRSDNVRDKKFRILSHEAISWQKRHQKLSPASPLASNLWEKILDDGEGLAYRLLDPVKSNNEKLLDEVRKLVDYLQEEDNLKKELAKIYSDLQGEECPDIFHISGSWQALARLKEAVKLAGRWIALHEKIEKRSETDSPRNHDLRRHLLTAGDELEKLALKYGDESLVSAGISICRRVLDTLERKILTKGKVVSTKDDLAALELSKNPQLELEPSWTPKADTVEKMGRALLGLINKEEVFEEILH